MLGPTKGRAERATPWTNFACGAGARGVATTIMLPLTVVKTRFEALRAHTYSGTFSAVAQIVRAERLVGLYSGLGMTLLRDVPFSGLYLLFYEALHHKVRARSSANSAAVLAQAGGGAGAPQFDKTAEAAEVFCIGLVAGAAATTLTHPFDVIRTRLQLPETATHFKRPSSVLGSVMGGLQLVRF